MDPLRVLVVDDEPLARERLRTFLTREPDATLIGECGNGEEAAFAILRDKPDVIFLDIQMPGLNGFGVLQKVGVENVPAVVFVTAFDEFALKAFEVHAVDYLLKPFDRPRFQTAFQRAAARVRARRPAELSEQLSAVLADLKASKAPERIPVKANGKVTFVSLADVDWIGSADNYVELHVGEHGHLLRETMNSITTRLPADQFVRISRTAIVNVQRVKELQPLFHGEYAVTLRSGAKLTLSRSYRDQLEKLGVK